VPVFALVLVKSGVAKSSSGKGEPDCQGGAEEGGRALTCHHMTMQGLAERLPLAAPATSTYL